MNYLMNTFDDQSIFNALKDDERNDRRKSTQIGLHWKIYKPTHIL